MYSFEQFRAEVLKTLAPACGKVEERFLSKPPDPRLGDLSCTVAFELAKKEGKNPAQAAQEILKKLKPAGLVGEVKAAGPYINFFVNDAAFAKQVAKQASEKNYGMNRAGAGRQALVEYVTPNPNKPLHIGHARNGFVGKTAANLLQANGWRVVKQNWINDRGVHICKAMLAYKLWGKNQAPQQAGKKPDHFVGDFYTKFVQAAEKDPGLEKQALKMLADWEAGDAKTRALWKKITGWAFKGQQQTYDALGIDYDITFYESDLFERGKEIVEKGVKDGVFTKEAGGAVVAPLEKHGLPNKVLLRADETAIYVTSDFALAEAKFSKYPRIARSIYVLGNQHELYAKQLFKMFELLGLQAAGKSEALLFGTVLVPSGKMSSREGNVVNIDDFVQELVDKALEETKKRNLKIKPAELEKTARQIALGAFKFGILRTDSSRDMVFDKETAVSFDGDTGPYVQYAFARCAHILEKLGSAGKPGTADFSLLSRQEEKLLVKKLADFPDVVAAAGAKLQPHLACQYLLDLVHAFSSFYDNCPVVQAESKELKAARAQLVKATANTLKTGLSLLGIDVPERM